jgi:hypothetical protein
MANFLAVPLRGTAHKKAAEGSLQQPALFMKIVDQTRSITA